MGQAPSLADVRRAWEARDPDLADRIVELCAAQDAPPRSPPRDGALTYRGYIGELSRWAYKRKTPQERARYRIDTMRALEAEGAEVAPPDRVGVHAILMEMWADGGPFARTSLLEVIARVSLRWGPWRALKRIFKEAEARGDTEVFGALAARFDMAYARGAPTNSEVSRKTLGYLVRRAWRYLRHTAELLPACYADAAVDVLRFYTDKTRWGSTWIANHIMFHESGGYTRRNFNVAGYRRKSLLKERAYTELWRRTPRPLFTLLERAKSEHVRKFAGQALREDFRAMLREVEPTWVVRLLGVGSQQVDEFVVWLLANVPKFEQGAFRELGLHDSVLRLLDSSSPEAQVYAAGYARTHARDLPLERLLALANSDSEAVRKLAQDLLGDRDPRKDVGLEAWGALLGTRYAHELAATMLRKHFGASELTREWFKARLLAENERVVEFARELLPRVFSYERLGASFFRELLDEPMISRAAALFALDAVTRFPAKEFGPDFLRRTLLHPHCSQAMIRWLSEERVKASELGVEFLRALAFQTTWEADAWVKELKASGRAWARDLKFNETLSKVALELLGDTRKFSPAEVGKQWLMELVERSEPQYHDFAVDYMVKAFAPADFATRAGAEEGARRIDLSEKTVLFTGTFAASGPGELADKVAALGGAVVEEVVDSLAYLVVGDEASPLRGAGRKSSTQVAVEKLIEQGSPVRIVTEAAFIQLLAGERREFSQETILAGCEQLWGMITRPGAADAPLAAFARAYILRHHQDISLALHDRPVEPGAEIPVQFLTFARVKPLLSDARFPVRGFALELARFEFARWSPPIPEMVAMAEIPYAEVREFVSTALLADASPEHRRYRVDPARLTADTVYSFCESLVTSARALGMKLIARHSRLAIPEELFRLTESPDRQVVAFVIQTVWSLYRERGITEHWKPDGGDARPERAHAPSARHGGSAGDGPPARPPRRPAGDDALRAFMRRVLMSVPPAKRAAGGAGEPTGGARLRPVPARRAKLALVAVMRDLAVRDHDFAAVIAPLLKEFMGSRGDSERAACMVALARIARAHEDLDLLTEDAA
ncbi:MAG: BRCT domain-containing protein [Myxococcales bacterium]|nr:BRCT domain-containing protein [Myxococcales bacterium]MCB9750502.1 BRCT domain-containing protein [Myxococcales bacterium]